MRLTTWFFGLIILIAVIATSRPQVLSQGSTDPCLLRENANHIIRVFASANGPGVDGYVLFGNARNQMISTYGALTIVINEKTIIDHKPIDCKDFRIFKLVRGDEVLGIVLEWMPFSKFPVYRGEDNRICARLWTTYSATKESCYSFYISRS